jgi:Fic family protein
MKTFQQFNKGIEQIPVTTTWALSAVAEYKGKQELFTKQSPQKTKALREHAMIESAVSSNRIEGVEVDPSRVKSVLLGNAALRDRDEEEVRGYRDALKLIHERGPNLPVNEKTVLKLHFLAKAQIGDAGQYKEKDGDIIEKYPDGRIRVQFKPVPAKQTKKYMDELSLNWDAYLQDNKLPLPIVVAAFNLDFLCIHPFRDGNGRTSRLLMLQQCYHMGMDVGRYISLVKLIEKNKNRYYETLEQSSQGWHEGKHDPWPYINYVLFILREAYREFESRVGQFEGGKGSRTKWVHEAIAEFPGDFGVSDIEKTCPGVGRDWIRKILQNLKKDGKVKVVQKGRYGKWSKI